MDTEIHVDIQKSSSLPYNSPKPKTIQTTFTEDRTYSHFRESNQFFFYMFTQKVHLNKTD